MPVDRPFVHHVLPVVLADALQPPRTLEQPVRDGVKLSLAQQFPQRRIQHLDLVTFQNPRVGESSSHAQTPEVLDVHRAAEALPEQHRVRADVLRQPPIAVNVRKIKLASVGEDTPRLGQHRGFIR